MHGVIRPLPSAAVELVKMALGITAIRGLNGQRRIVAFMALVATGHFSGWRNLVRIRQGESGSGVIESRIRPQDRVVALTA